MPPADKRLRARQLLRLDDPRPRVQPEDLAFARCLEPTYDPSTYQPDTEEVYPSVWLTTPRSLPAFLNWWRRQYDAWKTEHKEPKSPESSPFQFPSPVQSPEPTQTDTQAGPANPARPLSFLPPKPSTGPLDFSNPPENPFTPLYHRSTLVFGTKRNPLPNLAGPKYTLSTNNYKLSKKWTNQDKRL